MSKRILVFVNVLLILAICGCISGPHESGGGTGRVASTTQQAGITNVDIVKGEIKTISDPMGPKALGCS